MDIGRDDVSEKVGIGRGYETADADGGLLMKKFLKIKTRKHTSQWVETVQN